MDTVFSDWKEALQNLQDCVEKDLEEIRKQKAEVQQIKIDIFNRLAEGKYFRDDKRIVISAPEIIIGDVDKSGMLWGDGGAVVVRGGNVSLEGAGKTGSVKCRAPLSHRLPSTRDQMVWKRWYGLIRKWLVKPVILSFRVTNPVAISQKPLFLEVLVCASMPMTR